MANFFAEMKRRHIYRVAAAYAVVSWVLLQIVNNVAPIMEAPAWVARVVLLLLVLGFPVALLLAWMFDATPEGLKRTASAGAGEAAKTGAADWILAGAVTAVIALIAYQQFAPQNVSGAVQQATVVPAAPSQVQPSEISIAVLPFTNLSGDPAQEFFSDGITEEITSALANVQGLTVVGRTSAFEYKGQNRDMRMIGQALGVTHLIEGSVRKDGNRVRITAQLIRSDSAANLWAENYDRQLTDIFATQEDIAQAIAGALRVPLGLAKGDTLVRDRTADLESYDRYLRAKALIRVAGQAPVAEAITLLQSVVRRDSGFAAAWALLAQAHVLVPTYSPLQRGGALEAARLVVRSSFEEGEKAAREAIRLDSRNAVAHAALARIHGRRGEWAQAEDLFQQAFASDPGQPEVLQNYAQMLESVGRVREALRSGERLRVLEPFVPVYATITARYMQENGQYAASIQLLEGFPTDSGGGVGRNTALAAAYAEEGRFEEAADTLLLITGDTLPRRSVEDAARLLRNAPAKVNAPETLPELELGLHFVYAHIGAFARLMDASERTLSVGYNIGVSALWHPAMAPVRQTDRFKAYARKAGLVDYWRARGWPDLCRPVGAEDFECD